MRVNRSIQRSAVALSFIIVSNSVVSAPVEQVAKTDERYWGWT